MSTRLKTYVCVVLAVFVLCGCAGAPADTGVERLGTIEIASDGEPSAVIVVNRECYENDGDAPNPLTGFRGYLDRRWYVWPDRLANLGQSVGRTTPWPHRTPGSINEAVTVLVDKVKKSTGAELPVMYEPPSEGAVIYVGESEWTKKFGIDQPGMDMDGFEILFPDERSIVIVGPGKSGTEYGVYEFLERFAGVRWLMPGEHGTDIPRHGTISVPRRDIREEPVFFSRRFTGASPAENHWYRRLRRHLRMDRTHNLMVLFWVDDYLESHPHFYPVDESGEHLPGVGVNNSWQPCFNAEGIVREAASNIIEFFNLNPRLEYFSLAVNDGGSATFCHCEDCLAEISGRENALGYTDFSEPYYRWASEIAELVAEEHPDRYLVTLAYQSTLEPPDKKLHPNVIVVIVYEGLKLAAPSVREKMEEILAGWSDRAGKLGLSDYVYGRFYMFPRVYPRFMAEYYRLMHGYGLAAAGSNVAPHFGEGPKLYAAAKLKWNPYLDIEELLEEWYSRVAGGEGGPYLRKYYDFWEDFWTRGILDTDWASNFVFSTRGGGGGTFLPFRHGAPGGDPSYLLDVSDEEMLVLREWMESALEKTRTGAQRERVSVLYNSFEYYEATRVLYQAGRIEFAGEEELPEHFGRWISAALKREKLIDEVFPACPLLRNVIYTPVDMPFKGVEHLARLFWDNRGVILDDPSALESLKAAAADSGDGRLKDLVVRLERYDEDLSADESSLLEGLVLHLPLNEGEGAAARDLSGHENHGKITGARWVEDSPGSGVYSLHFGEDGSLECAHDESLSTEDEITVSVWIKLEEHGTHGWRWMIGKAGSIHDANYGWLISGTHDGGMPGAAGRTQFSANARGAWGEVTPFYLLQPGRWYHAAAVYHKDEGGQLYVDAFAVSPERTGRRGKLAVNERPLVVRHAAGGMLYDLRIYNRALSEEEVMALYEAGRR